MTASIGTKRSKVLHRIGAAKSGVSSDHSAKRSKISTENEVYYGLLAPVTADIEEKRRAMERIISQPFVVDANTPQFSVAQKWIEECGRQVRLPINFCGGLLIMRLYRLITLPSEQNPQRMEAVYEVAAAYDYAFLALGHADDESDLTFNRDGEPTRFTTHPNTRAVDGINLLLSGMTAMQETLSRWPCSANEAEVVSTNRHPLAVEIIGALTRALREASFPILLDRAGLGHQITEEHTPSGLSPILIDAHSLSRVEAFARHRAHTYFMRATDIATLLAGYESIAPDLSKALDELFSFWGSMGAITDDLQDVFVDFAAGIHSFCTVMAHLCVAEDENIRPVFRRDLSNEMVSHQRKQLAEFFGVADGKLDRHALLELLNEIELRRALTEYLEVQGSFFAAAFFKAAVQFDFSPKIMMEVVSVVCRDPEFEVPEIFLAALHAKPSEYVLRIMRVQVGKFITAYIVGQFWPKDAESLRHR